MLPRICVYKSLQIQVSLDPPIVASTLDLCLGLYPGDPGPPGADSAGNVHKRDVGWDKGIFNGSCQQEFRLFLFKRLPI